MEELVFIHQIQFIQIQFIQITFLELHKFIKEFLRFTLRNNWFYEIVKIHNTEKVSLKDPQKRF